MILNGLKYIFAGIMLIGIGLVIFDTVLLPLYVGYDNEHYVPDLRGYDTKEAIKILHSYGFYVEDPIERPYKENEKPDIVLNMSPRQFTKVKEGRAIKLTISGNRNHVKVPNVIGKSERNASFEIKRYRLTIDTIHTEYNTEVHLIELSIHHLLSAFLDLLHSNQTPALGQVYYLQSYPYQKSYIQSMLL